MCLTHPASSDPPAGANLRSLDTYERSRTRLCRVQYSRQDVGSFPLISVRTHSIHTLSWQHSIYDMTLLSFLIAFGHFSSEILVFRTAKIPGPALSPVVVSSAYMSSKTAIELRTHYPFSPTQCSPPLLSHVRALPHSCVLVLDDPPVRFLREGVTSP